MEAKTELQKNAVVRARRQELEQYQRALDIQWLNSRMEDGRMGRSLALIQKEAEMEKDFQERTDHAAIVNARALKETALGLEIAKTKQEEACELLRRHYLRERDPSLRELVKKLQAGYVRRDLQQQILHNEYRKLQEKVEENRSNQYLLNSLYNDKEMEDYENQRKLDKNIKYRYELQQQLVNRQLEKQCQYEDTLIEKKMLDDIMRTIADEDQREIQQKQQQTEKMRREMQTFKLAKDAWKQKQKEIVVEEERKLEEQIRAASDRNAAVIAERERKLKEKDELNQKIAAKILADEAARQERENLIKQLQEQEYLEKNVQDDAIERNKSARVKRETKLALTAQMEGRRREESGERVREREFRMSVEAKLALDEQKEREKKRLNREKSEKYAQELKKQIQENASRREKEKILEEKRAEHVREWEKNWQQEVATERKNIMEDHVPKLLGYLQPGVITHKDLDNPKLSQLGIESATRRPKRFAKCNSQCRILREY